MPSGPTGKRTHAGEVAPGTDAVPRTTPVEEWPFRTEKRAFRFPRGQAPEKKGPETSKPPRRAGHRAKRAHPSRQRAHLSHAPDRPGVFSVQACAQTRSRTCRRYAHVEGTRRSVSVEGTLPPREAPLRFLCQASSARTYADSTPLSDDRPTSETPRPQAGRVQLRRLHARRGLGGAGGISHRALVPSCFSTIALGARCDRVAPRRPACQAARKATRRAPARASESAAEAAFQCLPPPGTAAPAETWPRAPPNAPASPNTGSDT